MTVQGMIDYLITQDPNLTIATRGYEGGYTDKLVCEIIKLHHNVNDEWYYGEHDTCYDEDCKVLHIIRLVIGR